MRRVFCLLVMVLAGCANIKGRVTATIGPSGAPQSGESFYVHAEPAMPASEAIRRMLVSRLSRLGYDESKTPEGASFLVLANSDASYSHTDASEVVLPGSATSTISGNTVSTKFSPGMVMDSSTRIYSKMLLVTMVRPPDGRPLDQRIMWRGVVQESGWCPDIFVTAPNIISLMFKGFPGERFGATEGVGPSDPEVQTLRSIFPADSNWTCK